MPVIFIPDKPRMGKIKRRGKKGNKARYRLAEAGGGPSTGFSPTSLSGLQFWFRGDSISGADASAVSTWNDESGNNRHLTQGTGANQPLLQTGELNGHSVVEFDGTSDFMSSGSITNFVAANAGHIFCVAKVDTADGNNSIFCDWRPVGNGNRFDIHPCFNAGTLIAVFDWGNALGGGRVAPTIADVTGSWKLFEVSRNVNALVAKQNNTNYATGTFSDDLDPTETGTFNFGISADANLWMDGMIAEFILYNRFLSSTESDQVVSYLNSKYILF